MRGLIGNTIKLQIEYRDENGALTDPTSPTIKIYEGYSRTALTTILLAVGDKISTGIYRKNYVIPDGEIDLVYEVSGIIGTVVTLTRQELPRDWIE